MGKKYFVWSFDDGLEQDKKIVEILRSFGMGATFNLNSGLYGHRQMIGRVGNLGFKEISLDEYRKMKHPLLKYTPHYRIPEDEVLDVYAGFEIASHAVRHERLTNLSAEEVRKNISLDMENLSKKFHQPITGFAYPFGARNAEVKNALSQCGIQYARTAGTAKSFSFPEDPMELGMTCWQISSKALDKVDAFISAPDQGEDMFFLMFAHGYELDFGSKESSWEKFKRICDRVANSDGIVCCSTGEALRAHFGHIEATRDK